MKKAGLILMLVLAAHGAAAASLEPFNAPPETLAQLLLSWKTARSSPRAQVVSVDWDTYAFIIPAAGSLAGNGGTYFRSDITLANRRSVDQIVTVGWIARSVNNGASSVRRFTIPANTTVMQRDFVAAFLGQSGLGSVLVVAEDSAGNVDQAASIDGFSRIWTNQPGGTGTVSQDFPPVDTKDNLATSYGYGLRQDPQYRTNVGMVNLYSTPQTFTIAVVGTLGSTSFSQIVQPYSMEQVPIPAGNYGDLYLRISSGLNLNWWTAYGTSVDNVSGDGWVSHVH